MSKLLALTIELLEKDLTDKDFLDMETEKKNHILKIYNYALCL